MASPLLYLKPTRHSGDWCIKVWDFNVVNLGEWHLVKARR